MLGIPCSNPQRLSTQKGSLGARFNCETHTPVAVVAMSHIPCMHSSAVAHAEPSSYLGTHMPALEHWRYMAQGVRWSQASFIAPLMSQCMVGPQWNPLAQRASSAEHEPPPSTSRGISQAPWLEAAAPTQRRPVLTLQSESLKQTASVLPGPSKTVMQAASIALDSSTVILASA